MWAFEKRDGTALVSKTKISNLECNQTFVGGDEKIKKWFMDIQIMESVFPLN